MDILNSSIDLIFQKLKGGPRCRTFLWYTLCAVGLCWGLVACHSIPPRPEIAVTIPTGAPPAFLKNDIANRLIAEAAPQMIVLERTASIKRDVTLLQALWVEESRIVDARGTADATDDYVWTGRSAIMDRYLVAVFPNPPPMMEQPANLSIEEENGIAVVENGTDLWRFVWQDGRWWMAELVYSRPQ